MPYQISEARREWYRQVAARSRRRKAAACGGLLADESAAANTPALMPEALMPREASHGLRALSLFSGGGGLDLGFERAGFEHVASFDVLDICGATLRRNRPGWRVVAGARGDVAGVDWQPFAGKVDIVHGGPPCQPFSIAGFRQGHRDDRDMWPEFKRAVLELRPAAFVAENVPGLLGPRFRSYVEETILGPLRGRYDVRSFCLTATDFGVPQARKRVFFVGFASEHGAGRFQPPLPTHRMQSDVLSAANPAMGARSALGLPEVGFDCAAPTLRSGFTGPRKTTSVLNSKASQSTWAKLQIWPNGVQQDRSMATAFPPENGHFRLSVQDCAVLQGFPDDWLFEGAVYQILGQIGNSVCPPVGYAVARSVAQTLAA